MKNSEKAPETKTPRTLDALVKEFNNSIGNFAKFNKSMDSREKILFKGWLNKMRQTGPSVA